MGILDIVLGRDENGNVSKINMALIALLLWKMYQGSKGGAAETAPARVPTGRRDENPAASPETWPQSPPPVPNTSSEGPDGGFRDLTDAMNRMPDYRRDPGAGGGSGGGGLGDILGDILGGGRAREPGGRGGQSGGGGLGDILGDILGGGRPSGRSGQPGGSGGGGLGDILGDILGGGRPTGRGGQSGRPGGGGLGDILGDILGGGRSGGMRAVSGPHGDPFADLLRGGAGAGLGGAGLGGAGLGGLLGAGLGGLLQQFDQAGHGDQARSWISSGSNQPLSPSDIEDTFGSDTINMLAQQIGVSRDELLSGLAQTLPQAVDQMTPDGRMPTQDEISRWT